MLRKISVEHSSWNVVAQSDSSPWSTSILKVCSNKACAVEVKSSLDEWEVSNVGLYLASFSKIWSVISNQSSSTSKEDSIIEVINLLQHFYSLQFSYCFLSTHQPYQKFCDHAIELRYLTIFLFVYCRVDFRTISFAQRCSLVNHRQAQALRVHNLLSSKKLLQWKPVA